MRKRSDLIIKTEILRILYDGPAGPTRLSRLCNVPFDRLENYLIPLLKNGLVKKQEYEGKEHYSITEQGLRILEEIERILSKLVL